MPFAKAANANHASIQTNAHLRKIQSVTMGNVFRAMLKINVRTMDGLFVTSTQEDVSSAIIKIRNVQMKNQFATWMENVKFAIIKISVQMIGQYVTILKVNVMGVTKNKIFFVKMI